MNLTSLFVQDHHKIGQLINQFKIDIDSDESRAITIFTQLKTILLRHFQEEEILYSRCKYDDESIIPLLNSIKEQHKVILSKLHDIHSSLSENRKISMTSFFTLLEKHKEQEERYLYPEFDKILTNEEKEQAYWDIKGKW